MRVYHDFFLVPGSRSTFPDADPDPDHAKWYGFETLPETMGKEIKLKKKGGGNNSSWMQLYTPMSLYIN